MKQHGDRPEARTFRHQFSHRVDRLTDELVKLVETEPEYASRPAIQEDLDFLRSAREDTPAGSPRP